MLFIFPFVLNPPFNCVVCAWWYLYACLHERDGKLLCLTVLRVKLGGFYFRKLCFVPKNLTFMVWKSICNFGICFAVCLQRLLFLLLVLCRIQSLAVRIQVALAFFSPLLGLRELSFIFIYFHLRIIEKIFPNSVQISSCYYLLVHYKHTIASPNYKKEYFCQQCVYIGEMKGVGRCCFYVFCLRRLCHSFNFFSSDAKYAVVLFHQYDLCIPFFYVIFYGC